MIYLIGAFTALHILFYLKLIAGWMKIPAAKNGSDFAAFSVIIPVRNESNTVGRILRNLEDQQYPKELFEVVVVDDFSEDDTIDQILKAKDSLDIDIGLVQLEDESKQGKKHALTAGIQAAKYETILTTDADCWFGKNWIHSYNAAFSERINMIAGPVAIQGEGLFARLQQVEFAGLMGFGAVTISDENPSMCSGANLGFRKSAFEEVGGYTNNLFTPSGDDEFLLFNIMRRFPHSTRFLKSQEATVNTSAHTSLAAFVNQRTRWTSKWKYNKNSSVRISAVLFFLDYLLFCIAVVGAFLSWFNPMLIAGIVVGRLLSMLAFVSPIGRFLNAKRIFWSLILLQIIYPVHVLFMGMNSIFGSYTWKGRKYG